jgi:hypothetical protein
VETNDIHVSLSPHHVPSNQRTFLGAKQFVPVIEALPGAVGAPSSSSRRFAHRDGAAPLHSDDDNVDDDALSDADIQLQERKSSGMMFQLSPEQPATAAADVAAASLRGASQVVHFAGTPSQVERVDRLKLVTVPASVSNAALGSVGHFGQPPATAQRALPLSPQASDAEVARAARILLGGASHSAAPTSSPKTKKTNGAFWKFYR